MGKRILVIGSLNMDMVVNMKVMPLVGETILGKGLVYIPGGKGANQACAIGKLGGDITMLGSIGEDNLGASLRESLSSCGVDISGLRRVKTDPTGAAVIYVDAQGNNSIVVVPGANSGCDIGYLKEKDHLFEQCDYIVLQMEIPHDAVFYALKRGKELGKTMILNPAPAPDTMPEEIFQMIDYITPNETELMKLSGMEDSSPESIERGARKLLSKGTKNVLVTVGEKGALLVNKEGVKHFPARKVEAVDTTAAGDCFNGAFVMALSEGKSEAKAIEFANAASSIAVTRKGAQISLPARVEVEEILTKHSV